MSVANAFVDTNVFLYAISTSPVEAAKSLAAQRLLATTNWVWSTQVAAEFINASTSPRRPTPLSLAEAERWIDLWLAFPLATIDGKVVKDAIRLARKYKVSYYDAQILAAARSMNCSILYSEDLSHGQDYDGVVVENPFRVATP